MKQIQVAKAMSAGSAVRIVKKLIGEVEENYNPGKVDPFCILDKRTFIEMYWGNSCLDIEAFGRFMNCDFALELKGKKLWLFSIHVVRA